MPVETKQIMRVDLQPDEIIRSVKMRFRICNYLFYTGDCWSLVCVVLGISHSVFHHDFLDASSLFTLLAVTLAIFSIAYSVKLALYRCPMCDKHLGRLDSFKLHCPNCDAKVKWSG
jgi:hypothetical protein